MPRGTNPVSDDEENAAPPEFADWGSEDDVPDEFSMDLSGAKERAFEPLAVGWYDAKLDQAQYGRSKRSNNPQVTYTFSVEGGEDPDTGKPRKRKVFLPVPIIPEFHARHKKIAVSLDPEYDLANWKPQALNSQLVGNACRVHLKIDRYEGKLNNKVTDVAPAQSEAGAFI